MLTQLTVDFIFCWCRSSQILLLRAVLISEILAPGCFCTTASIKDKRHKISIRQTNVIVAKGKMRWISLGTAILPMALHKISSLAFAIPLDFHLPTCYGLGLTPLDQISPVAF